MHPPMLRTVSAFSLALLATTLLAATPTPAADRIVKLVTPKPIHADLPAMPQIAGPIDAAERRINAALRRLDDHVRKGAAACKDLGGKKPGNWERTIEVPMQGPGFLSLVIHDSTYCGGPSPEFSQTAIVYDLRTGDPVDWTALLPSSLTGKVALLQAADDTRMVTLSSQRLYALFLAGYDQERGDDPDCKAAVRFSGAEGPPGMTAWLDAKQGGLGLHFDLAHAVNACADDVVIPIASLRSEGAKPALLDTLAGAKKN